DGIGQWMQDRRNTITSVKKVIQADPEVNVRPHLVQANDSGRFGSTFFGSEAGVMMYHDPSYDDSNFDPRTRPWYLDATAARSLIITAPYISASLKKQVVTIAEPVMVAGELFGVVAANLTIEQLTNAVLQRDVPGKGYAVMVNKNGSITAHPEKHRNDRPITEMGADLTLSWLSERIAARAMEEREFKGTTTLFYVTGVPSTDWALVFVMDRSEIM